MSRRYWVETLGCPKNEVDSAKLIGTLAADGYTAAASPELADLVVVNTCAFIESARQESIDAVLSLADSRPDGARLVVTGCLAERYRDELAEALPEADQVAGFGVPVTLGARPPPGSDPPVPSFDLLNLPRPPSAAPWAYLKIAEGCDRACGFCAIPSFRGKQRSRSVESILAEVDALEVEEIVLVAQDLASYGRDLTPRQAIVPLVAEVSRRVARTRLLYLYPSDLSDGLIEVMGESACAYFDLSLQHVSQHHLRRMRRWGDRERFARSINSIRDRFPDAAFRSSFILGYPGETERDQDELLDFLELSQLDWVGFFPFCPEPGTHAATLPDTVGPELAAERLRECSELQDGITARKRTALIGQTIEVLIDRPGVGRSHREAPEIDGVVRFCTDATRGMTGQFAAALVVDSEGPDVEAVLA